MGRLTRSGYLDDELLLPPSLIALDKRHLKKKVNYLASKMHISHQMNWTASVETKGCPCPILKRLFSPMSFKNE